MFRPYSIIIRWLFLRNCFTVLLILFHCSKTWLKLVPVIDSSHPPSTEATRHYLVLNTDLTHNTTALHHNVTPHITQETKEGWNHRGSIEKGISFK
jgi:hypothetical protein